MMLRIYILILLLLAGVICTAATVNVNHIVKPSIQDFGLVNSNNTKQFSHSKSLNIPYNADEKVSENFEDVTESISLALLDVINLSNNLTLETYQFNGFFSNPSISTTPMIIEGNYAHNSSQDTILIDAHIKFSVPANKHKSTLYINPPYSQGLSDFGVCTKDDQRFMNNPQNTTPVPFPATVYLLGTALIILCVLAHKKKIHDS
ncbi:MAG: hypothetical protein L3J75_12330 [Methylococcaceae bacterium]|nr:hypothetical protein [Methylococcaceae bacterium]